MTPKPYEDLLTNPETFKAAQQFWKRLTAVIADSLGQSGHWHEWMPRTTAEEMKAFIEEHAPERRSSGPGD